MEREIITRSEIAFIRPTWLVCSHHVVDLRTSVANGRLGGAGLKDEAKTGKIKGKV